MEIAILKDEEGWWAILDVTPYGPFTERQGLLDILPSLMDVMEEEGKEG